MKYRVEDLAAAAGIKVDTVRFYQARGLLPPPKREKRTAMYGDQHLARLRRIRHYQSAGLSLALIKRLLTARSRSTADALLSAVAEQSGVRPLTRAELAAQSGVPEPLLASLEAAGILHPVETEGQPRYGLADLHMVRAGLEILQQGFPLNELLQLAARHDETVRESVDGAIDLFNRYVRGTEANAADPKRVTEAFRLLLPAVTRLVALHFQRTLLNRAFERLRERGEHDIIEVARQAVESGRLNLEVTWR